LHDHFTHFGTLSLLSLFHSFHRIPSPFRQSSSCPIAIMLGTNPSSQSPSCLQETPPAHSSLNTLLCPVVFETTTTVLSRRHASATRILRAQSSLNPPPHAQPTTTTCKLRSYLHSNRSAVR
ncbi:hypothetical protein Csa_015313, partial [Cucumis sativus]